MGLNKSKLKKRQQAAKNKKIRRKEQEDATGVIRRRKTDKPELSEQTFIIAKAIILVLIIISYFSFSTLLLPLFLALISLYYFSFWVERKINRSFNLDNKKRVFKMDSGLAFITVIISVATNIFSFSRMIGSKRSSFSMYISRIFSLSTGVRNKSEKNFGMGERPEGFAPPSGGSGGRPNRPDFDISDLPVEIAFTQILSSIINILILTVVILGTLSVGMYFYKKYFNNKQIRIKQNNKNEWVFSKEDLQRLLQEDV